MSPAVPRRVLLLCPDVITERMAGPAIRYWEFAKALAPSHRVTLAAPNPVPESLGAALPGVRLSQHHPDSIEDLCREHDIIVFQGIIMRLYPQVRHSDKVLVADLYDPMPLEGFEQHADLPWEESLPLYSEQLSIINEQLKYADYFLCANPRQWDLWLGSLLALGRVNPLTHREFSQRLLTIPFGLPAEPPRRTAPGLRAELDGAGFVLLWGGGIWEWFDPLTLIRAVHRLRGQQPDLRLVFLGMRHPNPAIPVMPMQQRAEALARELGVYGEQVIFKAGWVPYADLQNHLLDCDVGVSAHYPSLETHYSFRTRILHYLWAGKPVITTAGDTLAEAVEQHHAGVSVAPGSVDAWVRAIETLRDPERYACCVEGVRDLATRYTWPIAVQPLHSICANAQIAPDILLESGQRQFRLWDCDQRYQETKQELNHVLNSNSWRLTESLRGLRRLLRLR